MALAYQDAYSAIKKLEADGTSLPIPAPTDAILVGSIDAQNRRVRQWAVPTFQQTIKLLPMDTAAISPMVRKYRHRRNECRRYQRFGRPEVRQAQ